MFFVIDDDRKVVFGLSHKCACTSLIRYFYHLAHGGPTDVPIHLYDAIKFLKSRIARLILLKLNRLKGIESMEEELQRFFNKKRVGGRTPSDFLKKGGVRLLIRVATLFDDLEPVRKQSLRKLNTERYRVGLSSEHKSYTKILFIRDPYKRIVSGFLYMYVDRSRDKRKLVSEIEHLNFEKFVDELDGNGLERINFEHFVPQLGQVYDPSIQFDKIYDIASIDYAFINGLFGVDPNFRLSQQHNKREYDKDWKGVAYRLTIDELKEIASRGEGYPSYRLFYNRDIQEKVYKFYQRDFEFFAKHGFQYDLVVRDAVEGEHGCS